MGWLTPKYIHVISRAIQLATIEREKYLMAFYILERELVNSFIFDCEIWDESDDTL